MKRIYSAILSSVSNEYLSDIALVMCILMILFLSTVDGGDGTLFKDKGIILVVFHVFNDVLLLYLAHEFDLVSLLFN